MLGLMMDETEAMWATKNEAGVESKALETYINVTFNEQYVVYGIRYMGRKCEGIENATEGELLYDQGCVQ